MKIITVANLKGGSAKTTSAAYLAHAFAARGARVLLVDSDPQGSALRWSEAGDWDIPTIAMPVKNLHTKLAAIVPAGTDVVVLDTPPLDEQAGIVYSAMRAADIVLVTMAPTMMEFERLPDVWAALDEVESLRSSESISAVLLNRTVANASSTATFRDLISDSGHHVLGATIPRREAFAQAFAAPIQDVGAYADVADELDRLGE